MSEHKLPKRKTEKAMPIFAFARRHDIETEAGFILAGRLIVNDKELAPAILRQLLDEVQSGRMITDALIFGWPGAGRPPNAVDTHNEEVMAAWAKGCHTIDVRVRPRNDGMVHLDSDIMRRLGN